MIRFSSHEKLNILPSAILFDTDNTLYSYEPANHAAVTAVKDKVTKSLGISETEFFRAYSQAQIDVKKRLRSTASSHSRLLYLQRMLEIMGLGSQVLMALDFEQTYWRTFLSNAIIFDGVKELLEDIRMLSIPTCIVTDLTSQIQFRKVVYFGLDEYFDYIVTSEEAGADKPDTAQFTMALEKIKPSGSRVWMVGDNLESDILGARDSIRAITFQKVNSVNNFRNQNNIADVVFDDFNDLRALIKNINLDDK